jgi:micrococcal nuclease
LSFLFLSCRPAFDYSSISIVEVIDGDTVKLSNGRLLRYIGIDTPETSEMKNGVFRDNPQPFSRRASDYNRDLVLGKKVRVEFDIQKTDRYSRLLGYCFLDDTFVNQKLLEEGLAVLYTYPPNVKYVDRLYEAQKSARFYGKGLWGEGEIIDADQAHRYIGQTRVVRGRVLSTYATESCVYLNFGKNYKDDFTVVIFSNSLKFFNDEGIDPRDFYRDKMVEVRGRLRSRNGPQIIANSPYEIEVIP